MSDILYIIAGITVFVCGQMLVEKSGKEFYGEGEDPELHDIFQNVIPDYITQYGYLTDMFGLGVLIFALFNTDAYQKMLFVRLFIFITVLRALSIQLNILPKHQGCNRITGSMADVMKGNYDKIFSGHFAFTYLWTLIMNFDPLTSFVVNGINASLIISTRRHYTIDLVVSFLVVTLLWEKRFFQLS